jgi:hypothetical protein
VRGAQRRGTTAERRGRRYLAFGEVEQAHAPREREQGGLGRVGERRHLTPRPCKRVGIQSNKARMVGCSYFTVAR